MLRLGLIITRAAAVEPTWTTALVACGWLQAGHSLRVIESWDFEVTRTSELAARVHCFDPDRPWTPSQFCEALTRRTAPRRVVRLVDLDALWLRINPLNTGVLTFAAAAEALGVVTIPSPQTLLLTAHKSFIASLANVPHPPTVVSRSRAALHTFYEDQPRGVVVKPARGSGGRGVHRVAPRQLDQLDRAFDAVRNHGDAYVVAQSYLPEAQHGEKRLLWLNKSLVGAYLRQRTGRNFRHNLAQGGTPSPCTITDRDREICKLLTPHLVHSGVWLAGLDVIGEQVVEVNTLNPGGLHWIQELSGRDHTSEFVDSLESWIKSRNTDIPAA